MAEPEFSRRNFFTAATRNIVKHVPIPTAGVALGLAALGNLLAPLSTAIQTTCGGLSLFMVLLVVAKILIHPHMIRDDFRNSILASVSATFFMALMQLATYLEPVAHIAAFVLWCSAIAAHLALIVWFTARFILNFKLHEVFPTYFICYVGIIVASVTSPSFNLQNVGFYLFVFGFACYIVLLAVVTVRYVKHEVPEGAKPLFCIYTAPMSLSLAGYLTTAEDPNALFVGIMLVLGQALLLLVLSQLPKFIRLNFYPSFAAMTFPFVITAVALGKAQTFFAASGMALPPVFDVLFIAEAAFAALMVVFVTAKYFVFFGSKTKTEIAETKKEFAEKAAEKQPFSAQQA